MIESGSFTTFMLLLKQFSVFNNIFKIFEKLDEMKCFSISNGAHVS